MRFLSVCSGIEAASVAWSPLGWKAVAFSEIEPFPCALLEHHYPDTPNWGDMTKFKEWPDVSIDLLCGGTPCQSFSVAGLRKGLDDPRGNLMLTFGAIAAKYRPKWLVWENVPGVLSSNGGRDFGAFLGMLGQLGYGFAYRVLDAQYFGVAQRRRRVFVVGCLGDWRSAAAVLFERHSLSGHPAPSREAGKGIARGIEIGPAGGGFTELSPTLDTRAKDGPVRNQLAGAVLETLCVATGQAGAEIGAEIGADMAPTLNCNHEAPYAMYQTTHTLRGEGFDASEDGTGRGTPLVPAGFAQNQRDEVRMMHVSGALAAEPVAKQQTYVAAPIAFSSKDYGGDAMSDLSPTLRAGGHAGSHANAGVMPAIAFPANLSGTQCATTEDLAPSMGAKNTTAIAFQERGRAGGTNLEIGGDLAFALTAPNGGGRAQERNVLASMAVRRLTPVECERLQGFQDGYTAVPHRGKPAADGPRYKALGNSWAVPNVRWIGQRINDVNAIKQQHEKAA